MIRTALDLMIGATAMHTADLMLAEWHSPAIAYMWLMAVAIVTVAIQPRKRP